MAKMTPEELAYECAEELDEDDLLESYMPPVDNMRAAAREIILKYILQALEQKDEEKRR